MALAQENSPTFTFQIYEKTGIICAELAAEFRLEDWPAFEEFYRQKIEQGVLQWDLDLRKYVNVSTLFLGLLLGLNTLLSNQKGTLRLIVKKGSGIAELIYASKLNRIITTREI